MRNHLETLDCETHLDMIQTKNISYLPKSRAAYVFLILIWGMSGVILSLPFISDLPWTQKAIFLLLPVFFTLIATLARAQEGFAFWALILTLLVSQTGFQAQIGAITTSALEVCILALMAILLLANRSGKERLVHLSDLPGYKWLVVFILYSSLLLGVGLLRGDSIVNALFQFKGFLLYPLMMYLMLAGIRSERLLMLMILYMAVWYMLVSGRAILDFLNHQSISLSGYAIYRASGEYAPVNIFGSSAIALVMVLLGIAVSPGGSRRKAWLFSGMSIVLMIGAWTSVSRDAMLVLVVGMLILALLSKKRGLIVGAIFLIAIIIASYLLPSSLFESSLGRIFQLSDSSSLKRLFYLESGARALLAYWTVGAGWGNAFWYYRGAGLVPTGFIPWYHNDYLNLAVQIGLPGLLLYLGFWFSILRALWRWLQGSVKTEIGRPFVVGGTVALIGLLIGALFEHFLWRPDMGGLVAWTAGVAVAGMRLAAYKKQTGDTNQVL